MEILRIQHNRRYRAAQIVKILLKISKKIAVKSVACIKPFHSLVSTILSHRTRDEVTELVADRLLEIYPTPEKLSEATISSIRKLIRKVGFYRVKAEWLKEIAATLVRDFNSEVPDNYEDLMKLSGVGRKTAGCVLVYGFGKPAIPVDTHVHRISNRTGLVSTRTPEQTETELISLLRKKDWLPLNHAFVEHGKKTCKPIKPLCSQCLIISYCDYAKVNVMSCYQ
ncbi:MAG: endonuclease III [Planctomycetota bacterium]